MPGIPPILLCKAAKILDTTSPAQKYRVYHLKNQLEVSRYWTDLEYVALHGVVIADDEEVSFNTTQFRPKMFHFTNTNSTNVLRGMRRFREDIQNFQKKC